MATLSALVLFAAPTTGATPPAVVLAGLGAGCVALRRRFRQRATA